MRRDEPLPSASYTLALAAVVPCCSSSASGERTRVNPRDPGLANERTNERSLLAWQHTALSLVVRRVVLAMIELRVVLQA